MTQDETRITRSEAGQAPATIIDELIPPSNRTARYIAAAVAVVAALVSFFIIGPWAGSPETYSETIASLDEKRTTVMNLVAGSTGTSAAITLLPGDIGTPIAEQLLDLSAGFGIVIGALYLEKYLLTIFGLAAFRVLIPVACVLFAISMLLRGKEQLRLRSQGLAARLALFGIVVALVVPASTFIADMIDDTYQASAAASLAAAQKAQEQEPAETESTGEQQSPGIIEMIQQLPETISQTAQGVSKEAQETLNNFIETLAVMIVTSCVIPILVLVFFLWLARAILGVQIEVPMPARLAGSIFDRRKR